ncbi:MAG: hypothetical protein QUS07_04655 [Methanothrix sp.]|nr:hypothetical protein [Methanothrix sp.]
MAVAALAAPVMAQSAIVGNGGVDVLGEGIFETQGSAFKFPAASNTNYDSVKVGNDNALSIGVGGQFAGPFGVNSAAVTAQNNLKIKKNQDTGDSATCASCSPKYNIEQIEVGSRSATAIGVGIQGAFPFARNAASTLAQNNVEIVTNQQ